MNEFEQQEDLNELTKTQVALKRVEVAIRRRVDPELLLDLDKICLSTDAEERNRDLLMLTRRLQEK